LEEGKVLDLDGKMWPDAPAEDASSYKVPLLFLNILGVMLNFQLGINYTIFFMIH
jgi:hypothetical protein